MSLPEKPSFICVGAGAIGGYFAVSLLAAGYRVVILERPHNIAALQQNGLSLQRPDGTRLTATPELTQSLSRLPDLSAFSVILLATKSYDTAAFIDSHATLMSSLPPVLSLQNGVENEPALISRLGVERVIYGTVTTAVSKPATGHFLVERLRGVGIGGSHPLIPTLAAAFHDAGLNPLTYPDGPPMKWSKLLTNLVANATSAILDMTPAEIYANRHAFAIEQAMMREALNLMSALNLPIVDLPSTPVRALAFAFRRLPAPPAQALLLRAIGRARGDKMPSLHLDLHANRKSTEVDVLNGAVTRIGASNGVSAPVNLALSRTLQAMIDNTIPAAQFHRAPERLAQAIL